MCNNIEILNSGYSLKEIGICNWAFSKEDALQVLLEVEKLKIPILGGDVFEMKNGKIHSNYDNWYCDKLPNETSIEYLQRSIDKAKKYITQYQKANVDKILFALVL